MQRYTYVTIVGLLAVGDITRAAGAASTGGDAQLLLVLFHVILQVGQLRKRLLTALHRAAVRLLTCKQAQASVRDVTKTIVLTSYCVHGCVSVFWGRKSNMYMQYYC